jgi:S-formylglutathione hydrolase FrmB
MAHIRCDFFSEVLGLSTSMTVLLPQATSAQIGMTGVEAAGGRHPTLYLLHGLSDDDTVWARRTSIERYVAPLGLAVVMPQVHRSFYADEAWGGRYWTFLSEELPALAASFFHLSDRREDTFVAGLSMGGYGAIKWALRRPERFAAAASMSGALDVAELQRTRAVEDLERRVFDGMQVEGTENDLFALSGQVAPTASPALYIACGTGDDLFEDNRRFAERARAHGLPLTVRFGPGEHEWGYWDAAIQDVLAWLPLAR